MTYKLYFECHVFIALVKILRAWLEFSNLQINDVNVGGQHKSNYVLV